MISGTITVAADATLTRPIRETLAYDDGALRQGSTLPVNRTVATNGPGSLSIVWHVTNTLPLISGTFDTSATVACTLNFSSPVTCGAESSGFALTPNGTLLPGCASLVDEDGASLNGESIAFTVEGAPAGAANTNSSGIATRSYTPLLEAGSYATGAAFVGDALYNPSSDSGTITIAKRATSVTYTGALSGGPNKTIGLSATLVDATGTPLSGRTIQFKLGSQSASAVTNINGVAAVSLKLNQKNGIYPLTATWTPSGADDTHHLTSSDTKSFKLQAK